MKNPAAEERIAFSGGDSSWHPLRSGKCIFQVFLRGIEKVNMCSDRNKITVIITLMNMMQVVEVLIFPDLNGCDEPRCKT